MSKLASLAAALIVAASAMAPATSEARSHHRHHRHHHGLPYGISFLHNYGPGPLPGTFAYYDGPSTNHCYQSAAAYRGQVGLGTPCFGGPGSPNPFAERSASRATHPLASAIFRQANDTGPARRSLLSENPDPDVH